MRNRGTTVGVLALVGLTSGVLSAQNSPSHVIKNGEITARIYLPDAKAGFYRSTRFDWSGAIASLEYKGHNYYGHWFSKITDIYDFGYDGPNDDVISAEFTAMVGPAEEFGAIGYNDAKPGGLFVKPGIGVLRRADERRTTTRSRTSIANGGTWDVTRRSDSIEFRHTVNEPALGFGYVYTKVIRLTKGQPQMTIEHVLKNTGTKPIVTNVYNPTSRRSTTSRLGPTTRSPSRSRSSAPTRCAAWTAAAAAVRRGGAATTPRRCPLGRRADAIPIRRTARGAGSRKCRRWRPRRATSSLYAKVLEGVECFQASFTGFGPAVTDHEIRIENKKVGAGVRITGDRPMSRFGYWSIRTVLALSRTST